MWVFVNDRFVPREKAVVSVFDHGFLYGDGVYETLRSYGGRVFRLHRHLTRLRQSAELIGMELPIPDKDWPALLREAMERNRLADAYLRITVSRGEGEIGLASGLCSRPTVVIIAKHLPSYPAQLFEQGIGLVVASVRRNLSSALPPRVKSLNCLNNILAKQEAERAGTFDAVMLNAQGHLTECTASNLFFLREGRLCTPSGEAGILEGITREVILLLAAEAGVPTEEGLYAPDELWRAGECFLTNTTMEVMPVREINHKPVGSGEPGPATKRLRSLFQANLSRFLE